MEGSAKFGTRRGEGRVERRERDRDGWEVMGLTRRCPVRRKDKSHRGGLTQGYK